MYLIKKGIVKSFRLFCTILGRASFACGAFVLAAQGLMQLEDLKNYGILNNIVLIEQYVEKPIDAVLHANLPLVYGGLDFAPYAIFLAFFVVWAVCESERYRLSVHAAELDEEKAAADRRKYAEKLEKQAREQLAQREKEAEARAKFQLEEIARRERERQEAEQKRFAELERDRREAEREAAAKAQHPLPHLPHVPPIAEGSQREQLLELYAQTKKSLEESKKNLSFLAVDVVNSTGMKQGEDAALAERDFRQYKKLVERVITAHKGLKTAWTPDGVMICFASVQNAVQAAQDLIKSLEHFNREVKTIKAPFKVRCGINAGKVLFDDSVPMEEMTDRNIDIAGHMQKYAEANTIYIGAHAIEGMRHSEFGFRPAQKQVDGCDVYEWRADDVADGAPVAA